jgi:hypothetical protein
MVLSAAHPGTWHMICCQDFMARGAAINPTEGFDRATLGAAMGQFTSAVWNAHGKHELG